MGSSMMPYAGAAKAGVNAIQAGVGAYFDTKTAKATARAQARIMDAQADLSRESAKEMAAQTLVQGGLIKFQSRTQAKMLATQGKLARSQAETQAASYRSQGDILRSNADVMMSNRRVQDIEGRQALVQMGRRISGTTASYRDVQGSNVAQAAAGNVDISSGSASRVEEGNAMRYSRDVADMRNAYALQQWNNESQLSMMQVQAGNMRNTAKRYSGMARAMDAYGRTMQSAYGILSGAANYYGNTMQSAYGTMAQATADYGASMGDAYSTMAGAYNTVARLQGSAFGNAITAGSLSLLGSFLGGSFDGLFNSKQETVTPARTASPGGPIGYNAVGHQNPSYYESMGITL